MKKVLLVALLLLLPAILPAQETIKIAPVYGPVEHKTFVARAFLSLSSSDLLVHVGDSVRTGPGAALMLEFPDGAFLIVHDNSIMTIRRRGTLSHKTVINVVIDKVRFHIQRFGGKSNPRGAGTVTALIAVRG